MNSQNSPGKKSKIDLYITNAKLLSIEFIGLILCLTGIILLFLFKEKHGYEIVKDYTDCMDFFSKQYCKDLNVAVKNCSCYVDINITKPVNGSVTVYYEVESYYQTYASSRDDNQLMGELSLTPSESCEPLRYDDSNKPIAPCGALADRMFNDSYPLRYNQTTFLPQIYTGLISEADKMSYRNPSENLEQAFKNYSKPKNWKKNVWELDTKNPDNNGFQNEAFIAWMKTDLYRKPAWRVNHTGMYEHGLPVGAYILGINYMYPASLYNGTRKVIISSVHTIVNPVTLGFGITLLLGGFLVLVLKILFNRKYYGKYMRCEMEAFKTPTSDATDVIENPLKPAT